MAGTAQKKKSASSKLRAVPDGAMLVRLCGRVGERLLVEHPTRGTLEALTTLALSADELNKAIEQRRRAVACVCDDTLVVTGLLQPLPPGNPEDVAKGEPFVINAPNGLVMRCGTSSIRIMPDGRILLRGKRIVSRAELYNQIVGGSIRLN
jgi:hypothetical protein